MSINPALIPLKTSSAHQEDAVEEQEQDDDDGEDFEVERILDYAIMDAEKLGCAPEDWEPQGLKFEVRYLVKWKGYNDPSDNTWEPRRNFAYWHPEYDKTLKKLRKEKGYKQVSELDEDAKRMNRRWKKQQEEANNVAPRKLTKGAGRKKLKGEKTDKVKDIAQEKVKDKGKGKQTDKGKGKEKELIAREASPAASASSFQSAIRRTRTSRMSRPDVLWDEAFFEDMARHGNLPPELQKLRRTPPPQHDEDGNLIQSPSDGSSLSPQVERAALPPTSDQQYPAYSVFQLPPDGDVDPAGQAQTSIGSLNASVQEQSDQHPHVGTGGNGFAEGSDDDEEEQSRDLGAFDQSFDQPLGDISTFASGSAVGGASSAHTGWAGESDEDDDDAPQQQGPTPRPDHQFDVVVEQNSDSVAGVETDRSVAQGNDNAFAGSDSDEEETGESKPSKPAPEDTGFANDSDSDEPVHAEAIDDSFAGPNGSDDEAPVRPAATEQSQNLSRAPSRQASEPPRRPGSRPTSRSTSPATRSRPTRDSASPQFVNVRQGSPPRKKQDRGEGKEGKDEGRLKEMAAPPKPSSKPAAGGPKDVKVTPGATKGNVKSSRASPAPASLQENRALPPPRKKAKRVVESDEEDTAASNTEQPLSGSSQIRKGLADMRSSVNPAGGVAAPSPPPVDSASAGKSSISSALKLQKEYDPWNQGVERPKAKDGYVIVNRDVLANQKPAEKLNRANRIKFPPDLVASVDKVRFFWQIGDNPLDGTHDFDAVMLNNGEPRVAYIVEPPSSKQIGLYRFARFQQNDYSALQLVLSSLGIKQADSPRDSVGAVFIHVHKSDELGRFPGKLVELEKFRTRDDVAVYVYGETEKGKVVFKRIWRSGASITFSPSALKRDSARLAPLIEQWGTSREPFLGDRDRFPWIPLQYLLPGGAFGPEADGEGKAILPAQPEQDLDRRSARLALHKALIPEHLALAQIGPIVDSQPYHLAAFPKISDRMPLSPSAWNQVMEWLPTRYRLLGVAQLQDLVCKWRVGYPQLRRWIIIGTPEELELHPASPGVC
ncbi:hypothetical protein JCM11251_003038 [Rhodosporidiobolus azoricus]